MILLSQKKTSFMKLYAIVIFLTFTVSAAEKLMAQQNVGIGTNSPHGSSILDIRSNSRGLLIPRINLLNETDQVTIQGPLISLLVYNTNNGLQNGEGFYYWNGVIWNKLATRSNLASFAWGVNGNSGTNSNTDFIGTTDFKPLVFKVNNLLSGKIDPGPNNTFYGYLAGEGISTGQNNTFIGQNAGNATTTGGSNFFGGHLSGFSNTAGGANVFLGQEAGKENTTGSRNTFLGQDAGISNTTGSGNIFIGIGAGRNNTTQGGSVAIGEESLASVTTGLRNTAVGDFSMTANTTGSFNTAIGNSVLGSNTTGIQNTAVGHLALTNNTTGFNNVAVGRTALFSNTNGERNAAFGVDAMRNNISGVYNTACGNTALALNEFGDYNTALGFSSGPIDGFTTLNNTTSIGYNARVDANNTMVFGNTDVENWVFGRTTTLNVSALIVGDNSNNGNGAYLSRGGVWVNTCDVNKKEDFSSLDTEGLLKKISKLNIQRWKYKGTNEYHIGPTAQDFYKTFQVGVDDKGISTVDPAGITLAAIQQLIKENEELKKELLQVKKLVAAIVK
jgi:trimeric autotransporter adhesin